MRRQRQNYSSLNKWIYQKAQKEYKTGVSGSVIGSKLDKQTCKNEFESHLVPYSFGHVPHLSKEYETRDNRARKVIH